MYLNIKFDDSDAGVCIEGYIYPEETERLKRLLDVYFAGKPEKLDKDAVPVI